MGELARWHDGVLNVLDVIGCHWRQSAHRVQQQRDQQFSAHSSVDEDYDSNEDQGAGKDLFDTAEEDQGVGKDPFDTAGDAEDVMPTPEELKGVLQDPWMEGAPNNDFNREERQRWTNV